MDLESDVDAKGIFNKIALINGHYLDIPLNFNFVWFVLLGQVSNPRLRFFQNTFPF